MKKYIKRRKYLFIFLCSILLFSIIIGIFLYINKENNIKDIYLNTTNIKEQLLNNRVNNIFNHIISIIMIVLVSTIIIGYFGALFYLFYQGIVISFTICFLASIYGLKGIIFGIIYNIIFKLLFIIIIIFILIKLIDLIKNIIGVILYNNNITIIKNIKHNIICILILLLINLLNDIFLYMISNLILKILVNML